MPETRILAMLDADWLQVSWRDMSSSAPRSSRIKAAMDASSSRISPSAPRLLFRMPRSSPSPALYFTNLISARPLMGPAGAGSLAAVVNAAIEPSRASTA
jgi:chlorophyllide a reductase subunit Y